MASRSTALLPSGKRATPYRNPNSGGRSLQHHLRRAQILSEADGRRVQKLQAALESSKAEVEQLRGRISTSEHPIDTEYDQAAEIWGEAKRTSKKHQKIIANGNEPTKDQGTSIFGLKAKIKGFKTFAQVDAISFEEDIQTWEKITDNFQTKLGDVKAGHKEDLRPKNTKQEDKVLEYKQQMRNLESQNELQKEYMEAQDDYYRRICVDLETKIWTLINKNNDLETKIKALKDKEQFCREQTRRYQTLYHRERHPQFRDTPQPTKGDISLERDLDAAYASIEQLKAENAQLATALDDFEEREFEFKRMIEEEEAAKKRTSQQQCRLSPVVEEGASESLTTQGSKPVSVQLESNEIKIPQRASSIKPRKSPPPVFLLPRNTLPTDVEVLNTEHNTTGTEDLNVHNEIENFKIVDKIAPRGIDVTRNDGRLERRDHTARGVRNILHGHAQDVRKKDLLRDDASRIVYNMVTSLTK